MLIFIKMKKELSKEIDIPENVKVNLEKNNLTVKGPVGENSKEFDFKKLDVEIKGNKVILGHKKATKREKKLINTLAAHIKNMIQGTIEKFEYKLKICYVHFPFTIKIDKNQAIIKNFLGEKIERKVGLPKEAEIEIKGDFITIKAIDKEVAGQAAANLETATKIRGRDRRVFQDGIYITNKCGREL